MPRRHAKLPSDGMPELPYALDQRPQGARRQALDAVPEGASVLDIGCWDGAMGRYLIECRAARVDGVERDPAMAERAAAAYDTVDVGSVEQLVDDLVAGRAGRYDALLLMDVLEHLAAPERVLAACRALLGPGGIAVISLPNVAHWSVRKNLLQGRWEYRDSGILDRTHLRFYTLRTGQRLIEGAGWCVCESFWSLGQPPILRLPEWRLGLLARWPALFAVQQLYVARRA
jgi:SAM-dependent methyltransferase